MLGYRPLHTLAQAAAPPDTGVAEVELRASLRAWQALAVLGRFDVRTAFRPPVFPH